MASLSAAVSGRPLDGRFEVRETDAGEVLAARSELWIAAEAAAAERAEREAAEKEALLKEALAASGGAAAGGAGGPAGRKKERRIEEKGGRMATTGKLGGEFRRDPNAAFIARRMDKFTALIEKQKAVDAARPREKITITLPDGKEVEGTAWETSPMDVAQGISKSFAKRCIVAKVAYSRRVEGSNSADIARADEDEEGSMPEASGADGELWDMTRPLEGDCKLFLKDFKDEEGKTVFWHSSAHVLGECMEKAFGVHLTIGPPTEEGFYYDSYMGGDAVAEERDFKAINDLAQKIAKEAQTFERLVLSKDEALELFADNPFKVQLITNKVPDGGKTSAYRCGTLIDLCMGPHIPSTGVIGAFQVMKNSAAYWLGDADNDSLQRVYAVSFPDKKLMKQYLKRLEEAKKRDHRLLGQKQELFFFHELSPGSAFFLPHGAQVYNHLMEMIRKEYRKRGFTEVVTPNMFNLDLWHTSGHAEHYLDNMFTFDVEKATFGLKPMNCPGHCLMFRQRQRSYRELPLRFADFGVLHRNEFSGALTGLTRVRRFQQDDAHIFCREDQIGAEVRGALEFMKHIYDIFGFKFELYLSTRPKKALGSAELWDRAEKMMADALDVFTADVAAKAAAAAGGAGDGEAKEEEGAPRWRLNPGDGAFYGPKIDIQVFDALGRRHQCATIQLDFQLPIRFELGYKEASGGEARPVIVHRAILGSVERMMAILIEHYGGDWPFWLSPRQVMVVPVAAAFNDYATEVRDLLFAAGIEAEADLSNKTLNKKVREAEVAHFNHVLVVGEKEVEVRGVNVRPRLRGDDMRGEHSLEGYLAKAVARKAAYK